MTNTRADGLRERCAEIAADLQWYADHFCEHSQESELCGKLPDDVCNGCRARRAILSAAEQSPAPVAESGAVEAEPANPGLAGAAEMARQAHASLWSKVKASPLPAESVTVEAEPLTFSYRNYRGEVSIRTVRPISVRFGSTEWHPEPQWLLLAYDHDKQAEREFAMRDIATPPSPLPAEPSDAEISDLRDALQHTSVYGLLNDDAEAIHFLKTLRTASAQQGASVVPEELRRLYKACASGSAHKRTHWAEFNGPAAKWVRSLIQQGG